MSDRLVPSTFSLLKYENPFLVRDPSAEKRKVDQPSTTVKASSSKSAGSGGRRVPVAAPLPPPPSPPTGRKGSENRTELRKEAQDAINSILPPKEWTEDGQTWRQLVSSTPSTRLDVLALQEQLDTRLKQRQARDVGICPIRRELHSQCFDELIRHVTISCSERGFLLARVRDELNLTLLSYQTLYESSLAFGVRKALQAEVGRGEMEEKIEQLKQKEQQLRLENSELQVKMDRNAKRAQEELEAIQRQHSEEVGNLRQSNQQLKGLLEGVLTGNK